MRKFWLIALLSVLRIFPAAAYDITITAEKRVEVYQDEKRLWPSATRSRLNPE